MSAAVVYREIRRLLNQHLDPRVDPNSRERLALLITGILGGKSAAPARVAQALRSLGLSGASTESIERRVRRIENDPELSAALCVHPLARQHLAWGRPRELLLLLDPVCNEDEVEMLSVAIWYRGRALPLAWAFWPANSPLRGERFWARVEALLALVTPLLPKGVIVICIADRGFGTPQFTDLLCAQEWHYLVRVQGQTVWRDHRGVEGQARHLVRLPGQRAKLHGEVFKKRGWRSANLLVYWGRGYDDLLCLVTDLPAKWYLVHLYRRRYAIEATFRDYKSHGWRWEQGQVRDPQHLERLLVGMALATWIALLIGTEVASEFLSRPPSGKRHTRPWTGKHSLFSLGLHRFEEMIRADWPFQLRWQLRDWDAPNWEQQLLAHHLHAFIFEGSKTLCSH
jgi:Transposase DDE domain